MPRKSKKLTELESQPLGPASILSPEQVAALPSLQPERGPRPRKPWEPANVMTGTDAGRPFKLDKSGDMWTFSFPGSNPPTEPEKDAMRDLGFQYDSGDKKWWATGGAQLREDAQRLAVEFAGKGRQR